MHFASLPRKMMIVAGLAVAAVVTAGMVPWQVPDGPFRTDALRRIGLALNARRLVADDMRLSLLPTPRLHIVDASIELAGGITAAVPAATIDLKPGALLSGSVKPAGLALSRPYIELDPPAVNAAGFRALSEQFALSSAPLLNAAPLNGIAQIAIDRGTVAVRPAAGETRATRYENLKLRLSLPHRDTPVTLSASASLNGEDIRLTFRGASPTAIATAAVEPIAVSFWTPALAVEFDGQGSLSGKMTLNGGIVLRAGSKTTPPFAATLAHFGITALPALDMKGMLDFNDRGINIADMQLQFGRDRFDGAATLRHDGTRWTVSSTLAGENADLSGLFAPLARLWGRDGTWNRTPIDTDALLASTIDLRLSSDKVTINRLELGKVAFTLQTRPNRLEASLVEATVAGGRARLRLVGTPVSEGLALKLNGTLERSRLGEAVEAISGNRRFTGTGGGQITLETSGRSVAGFVANAEGRLGVSLSEGTMHGIDLRRLAGKRGGKRPELLLLESLGGQTPFEAASFSARILRGAAQITDGQMQSGRLVSSLTGSVDFAQGLNDLSGSVVEVVVDGTTGEPRPVLDFTVGGPLADPVIRPNISALLNRM